MAKLLYENRFLLTRRLHRQYCSVCFQRMHRRTRLLCLALALLSWLLMCLVLITLRSVLAGTLLCIAGLYFIFMVVYGYRFSEWLDYRRLQGDHGKGIVSIVRFNSDQVHVRVNKTSYDFRYSTIERAYETEDLIILILKADGMVEHGQLLYKRGFTEQREGVVDDFKAYLIEKTGKKLF